MTNNKSKSGIILIAIAGLVAGALAFALNKTNSTEPSISIQVLVNGVQSNEAHIGDTVKIIWTSKNAPEGAYAVQNATLNGVPEPTSQVEPSGEKEDIILDIPPDMLPIAVEMWTELYSVDGELLATSNKFIGTIS